MFGMTRRKRRYEAFDRSMTSRTSASTLDRNCMTDSTFRTKKHYSPLTIVSVTKNYDNVQNQLAFSSSEPTEPSRMVEVLSNASLLVLVIATGDFQMQ